MVAAVLALLGRDVAGVTELTRILAREGFLWCNPTQVSQKAVLNLFFNLLSCHQWISRSQSIKIAYLAMFGFDKIPAGEAEEV